MGSTKFEAYSPEANELSNLFKTLAHPARVTAVLHLMRESDKDLTFGELKEKIPMICMSTFSRHMKVLVNGGMVNTKMVAREQKYLQTYRINREKINIIFQFLNFINKKLDSKFDSHYNFGDGFYCHHQSIRDWQRYFDS